MHWVQVLIVFAIAWWLVFLPSLSIGIESQHESDEGAVAGTEGGAPVAPMLLKKAVWATIGAVIVTILASFIIPMLAPQ
jgi:predicted secreted protein